MELTDQVCTDLVDIKLIYIYRHHGQARRIQHGTENAVTSCSNLVCSGHLFSCGFIITLSWAALDREAMNVLQEVSRATVSRDRKALPFSHLKLNLVSFLDLTYEPSRAAPEAPFLDFLPFYEQCLRKIVRPKRSSSWMSFSKMSLM